jgi:hypothetical protein
MLTAESVNTDNVQNCWVSGLFSSFGILKYAKTKSVFPPTRGRQQIQFPKRCVFLYLEFCTMDKSPETQ